MNKTISTEEADKIFKEKYNNIKSGRNVSFCDELYLEYKDFCYNRLKRLGVSTRLQILMIKDMVESGWFDP